MTAVAFGMNSPMPTRDMARGAGIHPGSILAMRSQFAIPIE